MKDFGKTKFCLSLQIKYFPNGVVVHQSTYITKKKKKKLKRFYMSKTYPLSSLMVVWLLDLKNVLFYPCKKSEELLSPKTPYFSAIGTLMYLANCTQLNITFPINLLIRYNSTPTQKHWNHIKHILCYFHWTIDIGLFYSRESKL